MIITQAEITSLCRPCTTNEDAVNMAINEAETLDLAPQIGVKLYKAILADIDAGTNIYKELLTGCIFTDVNGKSRMQQGIKKALAYFSASRIIRTSNGNMTKYGYVVKDSDFGTPADGNRVQQDSNYLRQIAGQMIEEITAYLATKKTDTNYKDVLELDVPAYKTFNFESDVIGD